MAGDLASCEKALTLCDKFVEDAQLERQTRAERAELYRRQRDELTELAATSRTSNALWYLLAAGAGLAVGLKIGGKL